ncbi:hypothetical protein BUALT_Bualt17G0043000 [Buddleja alternifolia]|uniref:Uncharacterized protein n=1 Tax=Buddleja alternifolia TaxID=168488 RepID=A0AAV6WFC7_9LAMI|nr:hypothetical protein BUALT_Bualt17G0043000 [Buddleja alternifolia]
MIFMAILFGFMKYTENSAKKSSFAANPDPETITHFPIPPCEDKFFINRPCYDFVWSGNNDKRIDEIVTRIMANNPGRPIPSDKVKSFQTKKEMVQWIIDNPSRTPGALYLEVMNETIIAYGTKTDSVSSRIGRKVEDPTFKFQMPLQLAASREIGRSLVGDPNFSWNVGLKAYGHPGLKSERMNVDNIFIEQFSGIFYMAAAMFAFTFQVSAVVLEKELKHRQLSFGLFLSTFISKSSSTTSVAFAIFLVSVFVQSRAPIMYEPEIVATTNLIENQFPVVMPPLQTPKSPPLQLAIGSQLNLNQNNTTSSTPTTYMLTSPPVLLTQNSLLNVTSPTVQPPQPTLIPPGSPSVINPILINIPLHISSSPTRKSKHPPTRRKISKAKRKLFPVKLNRKMLKLTEIPVL